MQWIEDLALTVISRVRFAAKCQLRLKIYYGKPLQSHSLDGEVTTSSPFNRKHTIKNQHGNTPWKHTMETHHGNTPLSVTIWCPAKWKLEWKTSMEMHHEAKREVRLEELGGRLMAAAKPPQHTRAALEIMLQSARLRDGNLSGNAQWKIRMEVHHGNAPKQKPKRRVTPSNRKCSMEMHQGECPDGLLLDGNPREGSPPPPNSMGQIYCH
ncbi:hypothetical protein BKA70DRAFT_1235427 [Coprinopsis sp. MPI-PUGE-AT-0042]|nr:hypothetical protein BKA70DRAFT_1235427 [Coprinopsis sp. MPI-PUGE-AT-0042]